MGELVSAEIEAMPSSIRWKSPSCAANSVRKPIGTWSLRRCWWVRWKGPC